MGHPGVVEGSPGIAFVAELLGIELGTVIAFGDGENDVELLAEAVSASRSRAATRGSRRSPTGRAPGRTRRASQRDRSRPRLQGMIDLKAARANPDAVRAALARKGAGEAFDRLLEADERWRALVPRVDELRGRTKLSGKPTPEQREEAAGGKAELKDVEEALQHAEAERDALALRCRTRRTTTSRTARPRTTSARCGVSASRPSSTTRASTSRSGGSTWSAPRGCPARASATGSATPRDSPSPSIASRSTGSSASGFETVLPPVLVREQALVGTGAFPTDEANVYELPADDLYLAGTAEIPLASLHAGEILAADELPLRYVAFSPCFRREAGAAGRDTRGMFRVHQFNKVEQFSLTRPDASWDELELLLANTEALVGELGLPYRVVVLPAGDMSSASAKTYDVEIWFPSQGRYRETGSISNTTDFQARRLGIRMRGERGPEPVHTLNGTAVVDRMALAILENFQGEVPDALRAYGAPDRVAS